MWLLNIPAFFRLVDCFVLFRDGIAYFLLITLPECSKRQTLIKAICVLFLVCSVVDKTSIFVYFSDG